MTNDQYMHEYLGKYFGGQEFLNWFQSPAILYSEERIIENAKVLRELIQKHFHRSEMYYAIKACPFIDILSLMKSMRIGVEIQSLSEFDTVQQISFPMGQVMCNGAAKSPEYMAQALSFGCRIVADSHGEWERILNFPEANKLKEIGLRVNLGIIGSRFSKGTKLGVDAEIAHAALSEAAAAGRKVMLHVHVMSRAKTSADVSGTLGPFAAWFRGLPLVLRRCVSSINVGGGLDSRLNFSLADGSVEQCICAIRDVLGELADGRTIIFECGRYFVEDSGVACASVVERKTVQGTDWLLVDVGTNLLVPIPSSGFMIAQPFMNGVRKVFDVADGICSPAATIARGVSLPDCAKGARLFVLNCGAYTYSLAECFGTHIAPAYLLRRGSVHSMLSKGKAARIWRAMFSCSDDDGIASRADVPPELPLLVCGDCVLREFEPGDVEDIVQGLTPLSMSKYTERIPHPYGRADALAWLSEISANRLVGKLVWAVELMPHQKIIGAVELQCDPSSQTAKVMYWIGEEFQNRGFGRRVVGSVLRYGFDTLGLVYVTAEVHPDNLPSVSLLSRLGFIPSGTKRGEFERLALSPSDLRNVSRMGLTPPKDRAD